jgi:hypothetical protein
MNILLLIVDASLIRSTLHFDDEREAAKRRRVEKKRKTSGGQGLADLVILGQDYEWTLPIFSCPEISSTTTGREFRDYALQHEI